MPSDISPTDLTTALNLLSRNSSLAAVSAYLKNLGLASSASSWLEMREKRLEPALKEGSLNRADILELIRASEEHGRQHVFLFECSKETAAEAMSQDSIAKRLARLDLSDLMTKPRIVQLGKGLQLVEVRIDKASVANRGLVIKAVDTRIYKRMVSREEKGTQEIVTYDKESDRAINLIKVRSDGLVEVRIQSHRNALDYKRAVEDMFTKATGIVDRLKFGNLSLAKTRIFMLNNRRKLSNQIRFSDTVLYDKIGNTMTLASASYQQNLYEEGGGADAGLEGFLSAGRPARDAIDCVWLKGQGASGPADDIHTIIGRENNEFSVFGRCTGADYDYVLGKVTSFAD